ncbi:MAG: SDR family NAD(P)-dependent oxidoreductase [Chloroflexota bacterium]
MSEAPSALLGTLPLLGRIALITGAAHNIGRAIALAYAESGADVVVHAHSSVDELQRLSAEIQAMGRRSLACVADVREQAAVQQMAAKAADILGPIDVLVNNAAVRKESAFEDLSIDAWHEALGVTLDGAFHCTQAVIGGMLALKSGTIVNLVGLTAHTGAANRAHVVTAKAGIIGFTRALAVEYGGRGITVNGVSPGTIDTVRGVSAGGAAPAHRGQRVIPVGRLGHPNEIAAMCVYLASQQARYITGQIIEVNGGAHLSG